MTMKNKERYLVRWWQSFFRLSSDGKDFVVTTIKFGLAMVELGVEGHASEIPSSTLL